MPRKFPNIQKMSQSIPIPTITICLLGILPCCHALWSWKKLGEFSSIQWKIICLPGLSFYSFYLHYRRECAFVQHQGEWVWNQINFQHNGPTSKSPNFSAASFKSISSLPVCIIPIYAQEEWIGDFRLLLSMVAAITCLGLLKTKSWHHWTSGLFPSVSSERFAQALVAVILVISCVLNR